MYAIKPSSARQAYQKIIGTGSLKTVGIARLCNVGFTSFPNKTNNAGTTMLTQFLPMGGYDLLKRWNSRSLTNTIGEVTSKRLPKVLLQEEDNQEPDPRSSNVSKTLESHLDRLGVDMRRKGRINRQILEEVVDLLENGEKLGDEGATVLKYCSKRFLPDMQRFEIVQVFQRLWNSIDREGRKSYEHMEILLKCYTDLEFKDFDPWKILEQIHAIRPEFELDASYMKRIYYLILLSHCQRGDLSNAANVLQLVKTKGFLVDETFFNALIIGNSRSGDLVGARQVLSIMTSSNVNPSISTFTSLMGACIEHRDLEALTTIYNMSRREVNLTEHEIVDLACISLQIGNMSAFDKMLVWLRNATPAADSFKTFNLVVALIHSGYSSHAMTILSNWQRGVHLTQQGFGVSFIKELVYANIETETLISLCRELITKEQYKFAFNTAAEFSLRKKQFDVTLRLFEIIKEQGFPLRPHYFWPLIIHNFDSEGLTGLTRTLESMVSFQVLPDWETYMDFILPKLFSLESNPIQVAKIMKESTGVSYSSDIFSPLIFYLLKKKRLGDAATIAKRFKSKLAQPNLKLEHLFRCLISVESRDDITINIKHAIPILESISSGKSSEDKSDYVGKFILRFLDSIGSATSDLSDGLIQSVEMEQIPISERAAAIIQLRLGRNCNFKIDQQLLLLENNNSTTTTNKTYTHPKDMDTELLECHVQELKSKGMNTRGTLRRLFMKLCQEGDLSRALEIQRDFEKVGEITEGMKGALLALYIKTGKLENASKLYTELTSRKKLGEDWSLDLHKLLDLVTLLAEKGRLQDAMNLLFNDTCKYPTPENGNLLTRNVVRMLEAFAKRTDEEDLSTKLRKVVEFVLEKGIVSPTSPVLSVLIKFLLDRNEVSEALELFEGYAQTHKLTPANQLMAYSVLKEKPLLERYMKACTSVHGSLNTMHQLGCSFSDTGHLREAGQTFTTLGSKFDLNRIRKYCEYLADRREIAKVLNLAQVVSDSRRNDDGSSLYLIALKSCQTKQDRENLRLILDRIEVDVPNFPASVQQYMEKVKSQLGMDA